MADTYELDISKNLINANYITSYIDTKLTELENSMLDKICGVGEILITTREGNPSTWLGRGTWEQIKEGVTLLSAGSTYTVNSEGGETTHTLTENEMPSHTHEHTLSTDGAHTHTIETLVGAANNSDNIWSYNAVAAMNNQSGNRIYPGFVETNNHSSSPYYETDDTITSSYWGNDYPWNRSRESGVHSHTLSIEATGGREDGTTQPISLMQPYLSVYMWKRTA